MWVIAASSWHRPLSSSACRRGPYWARSCLWHTLPTLSIWSDKVCRCTSTPMTYKFTAGVARTTRRRCAATSAAASNISPAGWARTIFSWTPQKQIHMVHSTTSAPPVSVRTTCSWLCSGDTSRLSMRPRRLPGQQHVNEVARYQAHVHVLRHITTDLQQQTLRFHGQHCWCS